MSGLETRRFLFALQPFLQMDRGSVARSSMADGNELQSNARLEEELQAARRRIAELEGLAGQLRDELRARSEELQAAQSDSEQSRRELLDKWSKLRFIADASSDFMTLINRDFQYEAANRAYLEHWGKQESEVVGRYVHDIWGRETFETQIQPRLEECLQGRAVRYESWFGLPGREKRCHEVAFHPYRNARGEVTHASAVSRDITERKHAEKTLQQTEALYRSIFDKSLFGIAVVKPDGEIMDCNPAVAAMLGYTAEELAGKTVQDITHPEDFRDEAPLIEEVLQGKRDVIRMEKRYIAKDQSVVWADMLVNVQRGDDGEPLYAVATVQDLTPRKAAEAKLRESESRYRHLIETMPYGVEEVDLDGRMVFLNDSYHRMLGYEPGELVGGFIWDHDPSPEAVDRLKDYFERLKAEQPEPEPYLSQNLRKDGRVIDVHVDWDYIRDHEGNLAGFVSVVSDVTDITAARAALEAANRRLHEAQRVGGLGDWDWDPATNTVTWSDNLYRLFGLDPQQPPPDYQGQLDLYHPESAARLDQAVKRTMETGEPYDLELDRANPDGTTIHVLVRGLADADEQGRVTRLYGSVTDITKRKRAENELLRAKQEFENIFENSQAGIMLLRGGRVLARGNQRLADIFGYDSPEEMAGLDMRSLHLSEARYQEFGERYYSRLQEGEQTQVEYQLRRKDGSPVWCLLSGKALDPSNLDQGVIWVVDDLEDRKALEQSLVEAKEAAEAASRAKSEFLANMSHEVRTPLNGVMGMLQLLQATALDEEQQEYAATAMQSSRRLTRLLSDILDLSRVEAGRLEMRQEPLDLKRVVRQVKELYQPIASQSGVKAVHRIDPNIPDTLLGDAARLQQVLGNLAGNAFKFTSSGEVAVEATLLTPLQPGQARVLFCVADTGEGVDDERLAGLFEPFTQASQGYTRTHQGAGLGLAICKRLVNLMGGSLAIDSERGVGTTVYFCAPFPLAEGGEKKEERPEQRPDSRGLKVLLAEDEPVNRLSVRRLLEKIGHGVTVVENGRRAVEAVGRESFDVVLMDVQMPVMDGVDAARAIRAGEAGEAATTTPIIALTAYAMSGDREKFLDAGMDDYLAKPVEKQALAAMLDKWTA
jgi:PAS domain S-box-containing protein